MKRIALLLTVPLLLGLSACGGNSETDPEGNIIITMSLMNSTNENPGWLAMVDAANEVLEREDAGVRIETEIIMTSSWDEYYTKVTSNMMGRVGGPSAASPKATYRRWSR